ncbi:MAG: DUF378 domain-containing protein [archaeon]
MAKKGMSTLDWVAVVLVVVGGLNWGLIGAFGFDLVEFLLGSILALQRVVYSLVGIAAVYSIYSLAKAKV